MKKNMIVLIVRLFISIVGLACLAVYIAQPDKNQVLLSAGFTLNTIALLLSCIPRKKDK